MNYDEVSSFKSILCYCEVFHDNVKKTKKIPIDFYCTLNLIHCVLYLTWIYMLMFIIYEKSLVDFVLISCTDFFIVVENCTISNFKNLVLTLWKMWTLISFCWLIIGTTLHLMKHLNYWICFKKYWKNNLRSSIHNATFRPYTL